MTPRVRIALTVGVALFVAAGMRTSVAADPAPAEKAAPNLAFTAAGKEYHFDTGVLRGTLRPDGRSLGLTSIVDVASGTSLAGGAGLCSHYRLLDSEARYGSAAWDWASQSRLLPNGGVEVLWSADKDHPFDMKAVYRWKAANVCDVTTRVTAKKDIQRLEVFLASYLAALPDSFVYVQGCPETGGKPGFFAALESRGPWQTFPRDDEAVKIAGDGRWKRPPNPVDWKMMPRLAAPLAMRRDEKTGLTALVMAPAKDCFAVSTPFSGEGHRSIYLSLFGRDLKTGESATARSRLVIGHKISDEQAIALYEAYARERAARASRPR